MINDQKQQALDDILSNFLYIFLDLYPICGNKTLFMLQLGVVWTHIDELERHYRRHNLRESS